MWCTPESVIRSCARRGTGCSGISRQRTSCGKSVKNTTSGSASASCASSSLLGACRRHASPPSPRDHPTRTATDHSAHRPRDRSALTLRTTPSAHEPCDSLFAHRATVIDGTPDTHSADAQGVLSRGGAMTSKVAIKISAAVGYQADGCAAYDLESNHASAAPMASPRCT
jgi:hypothetical protein